MDVVIFAVGRCQCPKFWVQPQERGGILTVTVVVAVTKLTQRSDLESCVLCSPRMRDLNKCVKKLGVVSLATGGGCFFLDCFFGTLCSLGILHMRGAPVGMYSSFMIM